MLSVENQKVSLYLVQFVSSSILSFLFVYIKREKIVSVHKLSTQNLINTFESEGNFYGWIRTSGRSQHSRSADLQIIVLVNFVMYLWTKWAQKLTHLMLSVFVFFPLVSLLEEYKDFSFGMLWNIWDEEKWTFWSIWFVWCERFWKGKDPFNYILSNTCVLLLEYRRLSW